MVIMVESIGNTLKTVISMGNDEKPKYGDGAKVFFHFKTLTENGIVIDDSEAYGKSFELLIGKKFKIECWEECIKTMKVGERSKFVCPVESVIMYPAASKSMREVYFKVKPDKETKHGHQCGLSALENGLGYNDLDELQAAPKPLVFEIEVLKVQELGEYEREVWQMSPEEMEEAWKKYHTEGNELFKNGETVAASEKYATAISCLKNIQMKMRPGTEDWVLIDNKQIPLLLNHSQCMLMMENYQQCITNCSEVLNKISGAKNTKALFRRGKAFVCLLDEQEARKDFEKLLKIDPSVKKAVYRELISLDAALKTRDRKLSDNLRGMFNKM